MWVMHCWAFGRCLSGWRSGHENGKAFARKRLWHYDRL